MNVNEFDKYIRTALEDMEVPLNDQHWSLMEQQLDHMANTGMSDADLDSVVKENLQDADVPFNANHWALMEEQLNAEMAPGNDISNENIDQIAYQALAGQEVPYDPATWDTLQEKMDAESDHTNLLRAKTIEALLILLALLTILHFMHRKDVLPGKDEIATTPAIAATTEEKNNSEDITDAPVAQAQEIERNAGQSVYNETTQPFQKTTAVSTQTNVSESDASALHAAVPNNGFTNTTTATLKAQNQNAAVPPLTISGEKQIAGLSALPLADLDLLLTEKETPVLGKIAPLAAVASQSNLRIGMSAGPIVDRIYTPRDGSFQNGGEERWATSMSYQFGISAELKYGPWTFGSGAYYVSRQYMPQNRIIVIGGSTAHGFVADISKHAEMNVLSIPLQANYDLKTGEKWNIYATAGMNSNFVMEDNLDVQRDYCYNCSGPSNPTGPGGGVNPETLPDIPKSKGILEGGKLSDNIYFSAQAGFGIERKLLDNNILFIQPTYQHFIGQKGIGLHEDRFYSLSVLAGVKVAF